MLGEEKSERVTGVTGVGGTGNDFYISWETLNDVRHARAGTWPMMVTRWQCFMGHDSWIHHYFIVLWSVTRNSHLEHFNSFEWHCKLLHMLIRTPKFFKRAEYFFDGLNKIAWAPPPNSHQMHAGQLVTPEQLQMWSQDLSRVRDLMSDSPH